MRRGVLSFAILFIAVPLLASCGMMADMMGMGDKWDAMINMDAVMDEDGMDMTKIMAKRTAEEKKAFEHGREMFEDSGLGSAGVSCASCHPGGGAVGRSARPAGTSLDLDIPSLRGAAAEFPKYDAALGQVATLQMRNNECLVLFMDGKPLSLEGWDSFALAHYVTSFSNGESIQVSSR